MASSSSKNYSTKVSQENSVTDSKFKKPLAEKDRSIDPSLEELILEAKVLFNVLDDMSDKIRKLESCLKELKANFPFRHRILAEQASFYKPAEERHKAIYQDVHGYQTKVYWYLAWEYENNSKSYRLCLISEENDIIHYVPDDQKEIPSKILTKKPLIETDLSARLHYSKHLFAFIDAFKNYLKSSRIAIEKESDVLPF